MWRMLMIVGFMVSLPLIAWAQPAGRWEATLSANATSTRNFDGGSVGFAGGLGYYLWPPLEFSLRQVALYAHEKNGGDTWGGSTLGALDWHFDLNKWRPFAGVAGGYNYGTNLDSDPIAALEGGVKYYPKSHVFLFLSTQYQFDLNRKFSEGAFVYQIGLGLSW